MVLLPGRGSVGSTASADVADVGQIALEDARACATRSMSSLGRRSPASSTLVTTQRTPTGRPRTCAMPSSSAVRRCSAFSRRNAWFSGKPRTIDAVADLDRPAVRDERLVERVAADPGDDLRPAGAAMSAEQVAGASGAGRWSPGAAAAPAGPAGRAGAGASARGRGGRSAGAGCRGRRCRRTARAAVPAAADDWARRAVRCRRRRPVGRVPARRAHRARAAGTRRQERQLELPAVAAEAAAAGVDAGQPTRGRRRGRRGHRSPASRDGSRALDQPLAQPQRRPARAKATRSRPSASSSSSTPMPASASPPARASTKRSIGRLRREAEQVAHASGVDRIARRWRGPGRASTRRRACRPRRAAR